MQVKKLFLFVLLASVLLSLAGCAKKDASLPDLSSLGKITAVAREEGSGTKDAYKLLVQTSEKGANKVAASTQQVVDTVAADKNAIGYVAFSSLESAANVKALALNGVDPDPVSIASAKYPLVRSYLLAYTGTLSELETEFLIYIYGAGQKLVADYCTPVRKPTSFLSTKPEGAIRISGSSSVAPLMKKLAEDYCKYNTKAMITVETTDSTAGINAALRGDCDLAMSSRPLKSYEAELLETRVIAADGIAVIVNNANPLTTLSMQQLKSVYDGDVATWPDLK